VSRLQELMSFQGLLMREFSRRSIRRLEEAFPLRLILPAFRESMEANVEKEVEKDSLVIQHAAEALEAGRDMNEEDVEALFEKSKETDREFLEKISGLPLFVNIRYEDIRETRIERIRLLLKTARKLLAPLNEEAGMPEAAARAFTEEGFGEALAEILELYTRETRALYNSVRLPPILGIAGSLLARAVYSAMEEESGPTASEFARDVFRKARPLCRGPI